MNTNVQTVIEYADATPHIIECREKITAQKNSGELNTYEFLCALREYAQIAVTCYMIENPGEELARFTSRDLQEIAVTYMNRLAQ